MVYNYGEDELLASRSWTGNEDCRRVIESLDDFSLHERRMSVASSGWFGVRGYGDISERVTIVIWEGNEEEHWRILELFLSFKPHHLTGWINEKNIFDLKELRYGIGLSDKEEEIRRASCRERV